MQKNTHAGEACIYSDNIAMPTETTHAIIDK